MLELMLFVAFTIVLGFIILAIFPIFQSILGSSVSDINVRIIFVVFGHVWGVNDTRNIFNCEAGLE